MSSVNNHSREDLALLMQEYSLSIPPFVVFGKVSNPKTGLKLVSFENQLAFEHIFDMVYEELEEVRAQSDKALEQISSKDSIYLGHHWMTMKTQNHLTELFVKTTPQKSLCKKFIKKLTNFLEVIQVTSLSSTT